MPSVLGDTSLGCPRWWSSYWLCSMPFSCTGLFWSSAQTSSINSEVSTFRSWFLLTVLFNVGWDAVRRWGYEWIGATAEEDRLLVEMFALIPLTWIFLLSGRLGSDYCPWAILAHWGIVSATVRNRICWIQKLFQLFNHQHCHIAPFECKGVKSFLLDVVV